MTNENQTLGFCDPNDNWCCGPEPYPHDFCLPTLQIPECVKSAYSASVAALSGETADSSASLEMAKHKLTRRWAKFAETYADSPAAIVVNAESARLAFVGIKAVALCKVIGNYLASQLNAKTPVGVAA